jgi:hypothetical protein
MMASEKNMEPMPMSVAKQMKPEVMRLEHLEAKRFCNPRYMELLLPNFYKSTYALEEWPDGVNRAFRHVNNEVYTLMQGPSEFGIGGRLANWDVKQTKRNFRSNVNGRCKIRHHGSKRWKSRAN